MTIQPSILIWTVISFCLLMLILDRLLFRPMLAFMDKRSERIQAAANKKENYKAAVSEAEAEMSSRRQQAVLRTAEMAAKEIKEAKLRADGIIAKAKDESKKNIEICKNELILQKHELENGLDAGVDRLARAFADKLTS